MTSSMQIPKVEHHEIEIRKTLEPLVIALDESESFEIDKLLEKQSREQET